MAFVFLGFGLVWDLTLFLPLRLFPFVMGMSIVYLSYHCILEAQNLSGFTGAQLGGILSQDESYLESHSLDDI